MNIKTISIEQSVRMSHCSNRGKEHACIGVCTISREGIELNCTLCGSDSKWRVKTQGHTYDRAKRILDAAGIGMDGLNIEAQERVIREIQRDECPNCNAYHFREPYRDYFSCACGWVYTGRGWKAGSTAECA